MKSLDTLCAKPRNKFTYAKKNSVYNKINGE